MIDGSEPSNTCTAIFKSCVSLFSCINPARWSNSHEQQRTRSDSAGKRLPGGEMSRRHAGHPVRTPGWQTYFHLRRPNAAGRRGDVDKDRPLSGDDEPPDPTWANDRRLGPDATPKGGRTFDRHNSVSATGSEASHLGQLIRKRLAGREVILPEHSGRLAPILRKPVKTDQSCRTGRTAGQSQFLVASPVTSWHHI